MSNKYSLISKVIILAAVVYGVLMGTRNVGILRFPEFRGTDRLVGLGSPDCVGHIGRYRRRIHDDISQCDFRSDRDRDADDKKEKMIEYLIVINVITFILFVADKIKAQRGEWRISEKTLLSFSAIGGSLGGLAAMYLVRHKTKTPLFVWGMPAILVLQVAVLLYIR